MAQIDASRFLAKMSQLFAPNIQEGQVFLAYIGEDNSFHVQADNILKTSVNSNPSSSEQVDDLDERLIALQSKANDFETFCLTIPALQAQIQTLSGSTEGENSTDFDYAFVIKEIGDIRADISYLNDQVEYLNSQVDKLWDNIYFG